jgi:hypothetical protein
VQRRARLKLRQAKIGLARSRKIILNLEGR